MTYRITIVLALSLAALAHPALADKAVQKAAASARPRKPAPPAPKVTDLRLTGEIEGANITFTLDCQAETQFRHQNLALVSGDVVLEHIQSPDGRYILAFEEERGTYTMTLDRKGTHHVRFSFAARPKVMQGTQWREATFEIPAARFRALELVCDRTNLEVIFPDAMKVEQRIKDGQLRITAIQGRDRTFTVRWKPKVQELEAKLVLASDANTIAMAGAGALRIDTLFDFAISQGKLEKLSFDVPRGQSITQVRGVHIRDWSVRREADQQVLTVVLNRPQTTRYGLQILAEAPLGAFPVEADLPVIAPRGGIRAGGHLAVGTDSAIQLLVKETSGLSQIDAAAFKRIMLDREHPRPLPTGKAFFYTYAGNTYRMKLALDNIVPSFDVVHQIVVQMREDDLILGARMKLDVRDAPVRRLVIKLPAGFLVADVKGTHVDDYSVHETRSELEVHFAKPLLGRAIVEFRLELGRDPLDKTQKIDAFSVRGAKNERGYLLIVPDDGIRLDAPADDERLREVHTGSVPIRVANAEYAYRFREKGWTLQLLAHRETADVRVELFHLISLADGLAYGGVTANYFVTGSPVDELHFKVPPRLKNVEFVGRDVLQAKPDPDNLGHYIVKLNRKVIGDYNLGISYTQPHKDGETVLVGGIECERVQTQVGFLVIASQLNIDLSADPPTGGALLEIAREEVPPNYLLLVNAPILKTFKYVDVPHQMTVKVNTFDRGHLLPVVIEVMQIETSIAVRDLGNPESVTRVRYMVKNASKQFLALKAPGGAKIWTTRIIKNFGQPDQRAKPVTASFDPMTGHWLVPLKRTRDPNQPIAIEVEYGQVHIDPGGGTPGRRIALQAPLTHGAQSTFDHWSVRVPNQWAVQPTGGGNMIVEPRDVKQGNLALVMAHVGSCWSASLKHWISVPKVGFVALVILGLLLLVFIFKRSALPDLTLALLLAATVWVGLSAAGVDPFDLNGNAIVFSESFASPDKLTALQFTQQVNLDDRTPLSIELQVVPSWRQHATMLGSIAFPITASVCLIGAAFIRPLRKVLIAVALALGAFTAAQFPVSTLVLGHLLTWGVPALLAIGFLWHLIHRFSLPARRVRHAATGAAAVLLAALLAQPACAAAFLKPATVGGDPHRLNRIDCDLTAGTDSMQIDLKLNVSVASPARFRLFDQTAILMTSDRPGRDVEVAEEGEHYLLSIKRRGTYDLKLRFLYPLARPDTDQRRSLHLPLPPALSNRVRLTVPDRELEMTAPGAIRFDTREGGDATIAEAIFGPRDPAAFTWKPRARQRRREQTVFFAETVSAVRFDSGLTENRHQMRFQIAQGELSEIRMDIPENMTVTSVDGADVGAWRFDPAGHQLDIHLTRPASGTYGLLVTTQMSAVKLPYTASIRCLTIHGAERQHGVIGLLHSNAVYLDVKETGPQPMNVDDFARRAAVLLAKLPGYEAGAVRHAYRVQEPDDVVEAEVLEVRPEFQAIEVADFTVADDRLVYNGKLSVQVAKAGVFSVLLRFPKDFDIDALTHPLVSHWDEQIIDDSRVVEVHFRQKVLGDVPLALALSWPVSELPKQLIVPRIELVGALKHKGRINISSDRGVRLSVAERYGVSEIDPRESGAPPKRVQQFKVLSFKLLRPDWRLSLETAVIKPRLTVRFLHVAKVSEGLVRHIHYLRHELHNAGSKTFEIQVPPDAMGLLIMGRDIARRQEIGEGSGRYRIELTRKEYDRPYLLKVQYETRFDRSSGETTLAPVKALGADLQRGYVVVRGSDRVLLTAMNAGPPLRTDDPRSVPALFGAEDLSDAVLCYSTNSADYGLGIALKRHVAGPLLEADVTESQIWSVITESGTSMTRVVLDMRVGTKRHLVTRLPGKAKLWSLLVNGRPTLPSITKDRNNRDVLLLPLAHIGSGELFVQVDFVYVTPAPVRWRWDRPRFVGPSFDLPLRNIKWKLFVPEGFDYDDFEGTLAINEDVLKARETHHYDLKSYEAEVRRVNVSNQRIAIDLLKAASKQVDLGRQREARVAYEAAINYSQNDPALNEDARVQLKQLLQQQAIVGLVGSRGRLRQQTAAAAPGQAQAPLITDRFSRQDAERITNALSKPDSENLELITNRMIQWQQQAARTGVQLVVNMPLRGRVLEFDRPIQVVDTLEMYVAFKTRPLQPKQTHHSFYWAAALFAVLLVVFFAAPRVGTQWQTLRDGLEGRHDREEEGEERVQ